MPSLEQKKTSLRNEISRSLLISEAEKNFWLEKIEELPEVNLDRLFDQFQSKNKIVDGFIQEALDNDPDHHYLFQLKNLHQKIKKKGFQIEETTQQPNAESFLENELNNL